jgi:hypothetical protein
MAIVASPNATYMEIEVSIQGTSLPPGTYSFGPNAPPQQNGSYVVGSFGVENAAGTGSLGAVLPATSGSVTITSVNTMQVSGSYDLIFDTRDHVTGTFSAPLCPTSADAGGG